MGTVHTFITEVFGELIHTLETTYYKTFQVKLICDTKIQRDIKSIMVSNEGTSSSSSGNRL